MPSVVDEEPLYWVTRLNELAYLEGMHGGDL